MNSLPKLNTKAPSFIAEYYDGTTTNTFSIESFFNKENKKWLVLFFYPFDFSFICPTEICGLNDLYSEFLICNCEIICVSIDNINTHKAFHSLPRSKGGLSPCSIKLIDDSNQKISSIYGVINKDGGYEGASQRASFIVNPMGVIRSIDINDIQVGRSIDVLLEKVRVLIDLDKEVLVL